MAEGFGLPCPPPDPEEDDISDSSLDDDFAPKNLDGLLIVSTRVQESEDRRRAGNIEFIDLTDKKIEI